jgi:hypothetical protein
VDPAQLGQRPDLTGGVREAAVQPPADDQA